MSVEIFTKERQVRGSFNNGEILEYKPIGFPQDGGFLKPYSNLFYWAHAWTPGKKSTIGLHPHQGFEICSFVLKGKINHFDTKQNKWISLSEGDVQVIRSGNGISHAEEIDAESEIFQIWFDPNLSVSLKEDATYNDYKSDDFIINDFSGGTIKTILGVNSPMKIKTENILINCYSLEDGIHSINLKIGMVYSFFILSGKINFNDNIYDSGTFFKIDDLENFKFKTDKDLKLFEIISPQNPSYKTYATMS